jgi:2-hydroxy-6-oxonona-2,4-dienedioate hydrolase
MLDHNQKELLAGGVPRDGETPAECVARFEQAAEVLKTPCGDGHLVWHKWGEGTPVVMFHGNHGSWTHWIRNIPVLAENYAVYCSDAPGLGDSDLPPEPYSLENIIDAFAAGVDEIIPADQRMHFVGFSYGSAMAANTALRFKERANSLTMCASARLTAKAEVAREMKSWRRLETEEERMAAHRHNLAEMMIAKPERVDDLAVYLQSCNAPRARIRTKNFIPRDNLIKALIALKGVPIRNVWGTEDGFYPHFVEGKEELIDGNGIELDIKLLEGVAHWSPYEASKEVNAWLLEWFRAHD